MYPVAMLQPVRLGQASGLPVDRRAVGGNVVQPVPAISEMNLAMLARDESFRIGKRPIQKRITPDINATPINLDEDRATVW
jgi:hypothetical protein